MSFFPILFYWKLYLPYDVLFEKKRVLMKFLYVVRNSNGK